MHNFTYLEAMDFLNSPGNWLEKYLFLKDKVETSQQSDALKNNFNAMFIYCLVKAKINLEDFSDVIKHIYKNDDNNCLKYFFSLKTNLLLFSRYSKVEKYSNSYSIYDNIGYLFLDLENNKITLDKNNIDYLCILIKEIKDIELLEKAGFIDFFKNLIINLDNTNMYNVSQLLKEIDNNPLLKQDNTLLSLMLIQLGKNSFINNNSKYLYEFLTKTILNTNSLLEELLFTTNENLLAINNNILHFYMKSEVNVIPIIHHRFNIQYNDYIKTNNELEDCKYYQKLIYQFSSTLNYHFESNDYDIDFTLIDITKNFYENYILLKLLEINILKKNTLLLDKKVAQYIIELFDKPHTPSMVCNLYGVHNYIKENILVPYLKTYVMHDNLDKKLINKISIEETKNKI